MREAKVGQIYEYYDNVNRFSVKITDEQVRGHPDVVFGVVVETNGPHAIGYPNYWTVKTDVEHWALISDADDRTELDIYDKLEEILKKAR